MILAQFIGLFFFGMIYYLDLTDLSRGCSTFFFTGWLFPYVIVGAIFVRVLHLLLVFNLNRGRLEDAKPSVRFLKDVVVTSLVLYKP
jgi:hypothetical protein